MCVYVREISSPLELVNSKIIIEKLKSIKFKTIKKLLKEIIKIIIKLYYEYFYKTGKIKVIENNNSITCLIPVKESNNKKIILKWIKNLNNFLNKKELNYFIISNKLKQIELLNNSLYINKDNQGKTLLKFMIDDVIKYICNIKNESVENQNIYFLVNNYSKDNLEIIKYLANKVKNINIVTNNLKKFLIFSDKIYNTNGIMCSVSNNKRKALSKANFIINLDFTEENIHKYNINRTAIFCNLAQNINISKGFSGIMINGLQIQENVTANQEIKNYNLFNQTEIYTSIIDANEDFNSVKEKIIDDNIKIESLIGTKGALSKREFF